MLKDNPSCRSRLFHHGQLLSSEFTGQARTFIIPDDITGSVLAQDDQKRKQMTRIFHLLPSKILKESCLESQKEGGGIFSLGALNLVEACQRLIRQVLPTGHPPTLHRISGVLGVPTRILQRCLQASGFTYSRLLGKVRLHEAQRLLKESDARLADVAVVLGFRDPSNFSRAFLRWTGLSPKQYRRRFAVFSADRKRQNVGHGTK